MKRILALGASFAVLLACGVVRADVASEVPGVAPAPPMSPHWVFLTDAAFFHLTEGKIVIVDADRSAVVAKLTTGYLANSLLSADGKEMYVAETFWSRGTRGTQTDVVTVYDMTTFLPAAEIVLPGRFLAVTQPYNMGLSPDGGLLYVFNMTPATSVIVVDLKARAVLGEIETAGCALVFPGKDRFVMPCGDGTFLEVEVDSAGAEVSRRRTEKPIFDAETDPVSERPAATANGYAFVSYGGRVYEVDLSGGAPVYAEPWSLTSEKERADGWLPGGWEHSTYSPHSNELFVGMHQGGPGTHEQPGAEIWVFDMATKKRVRVLKPAEGVISIAMSRDDKPVLGAITETLSLSVMDPVTGEQKANLSGLMELGLVIEMP
jgi:methylamine dehydrogenase heavy chain